MTGRRAAVRSSARSRRQRAIRAWWPPRSTSGASRPRQRAGRVYTGYSRRPASPCDSSPCDTSEWSALGDVSLPGSFFLPAEDPFSTLRLPSHFCDDTCHFPEFLQVGEYSYSVDSGYCDYVTMVQPTRTAIAVGDPILIRFWHFALNAPDGGRAYLAIQVGDHMAW